MLSIKSAIALWLFVALQSCNLLKAQGVDNFWLLGYKYTNGLGGNMLLNFDTVPLFPQTVPRKMSFDAAEATISNKNGKLLFYTNGIFIADASNDTMLNGSGISDGSFANQFVDDGIPVPQEVIILPHPGDTSKYYMFYHTNTLNLNGWYMPPALFYCDIDITQNNGLGAVIQKNISLINDTLIAGEITACKHANGRDWWLITHRYMSQLYYKFLVTPDSIYGPYPQNIGSFMMYRGLSQSCFSPNGKKFACYHPLEDLDIMDFDRCTGDFSNFVHVPINDSAASGGVAFSSNSKILYVSSTSYVYQFNLEDTNIAGSQLKIATWDGFYSPFPPLATTFYLSQLAPDGKIYITSTNSVKHIHVINYPDSLGLACGLIQHSLAIPEYNFASIPNHPNYFLGADSGSVCDTLQLGISSPNLLPSDKKLSVSPNPARDFIELTYLPSDKLRIVEVLDLNGKSVLKSIIPEWSQSHKLSVNQLVEGLYLCRLVGKKQESLKFIIAKD